MQSMASQPATLGSLCQVAGCHRVGDFITQHRIVYLTRYFARWAAARAYLPAVLPATSPDLPRPPLSCGSRRRRMSLCWQRGTSAQCEPARAGRHVHTWGSHRSGRVGEVSSESSVQAQHTEACTAQCEFADADKELARSSEMHSLHRCVSHECIVKAAPVVPGGEYVV